jgi:hypothetical protein
VQDPIVDKLPDERMLRVIGGKQEGARLLVGAGPDALRRGHHRAAQWCTIEEIRYLPRVELLDFVLSHV